MEKNLIRLLTAWTDTEVYLLRLNSSVFSSSQNAWKVVLNKDWNYVEYHLWKWYWTWIQEWTLSLDSQALSSVQKILNSEDTYLYKETRNANTNTFRLLKITATFI